MCLTTFAASSSIIYCFGFSGSLGEGLRPDWIYKRGDVYWADLNPFFGSEQGGTRPVLVLQNDAGNFFSPTLIIAPMSSQVDKRTDLPTHIVLEQVRGLEGPSLIMLEQLKTIDKRRVRSYAGKLTKEQMTEVEAALTGTLGIYITEAVEAP
jgi:mRNA interferase MazF